MSTNAVQSSAYNYAYETNGAKEKEAKNTIGADDSVFLGCIENDADKTDKTSATDFEYACTDGDNDGKLGTGEFCKSAFKGVAKLVMSPITEAMKGNFLPAIGAAAGAVAISVLGAPAVVAAGAIGVVTGGAMLIDGGMKYFSAETDGEAKKAAEQIGGGGFTFLSSIFAFKGGMKTLKKSDSTHLGQYYDNKGRVLKDASGKKIKPTFGEKVKAYGQDFGDSFGNAGHKLTAGSHKGTTDTPDAAIKPDDGVPLGDDGIPATGAGAADDGIPVGGTKNTTDLYIEGPDGQMTINPDYQPAQQPATGVQPEVRPFEFKRITAEEAAGSRGGQGPKLGETSLTDDILKMAQGEAGSPISNPFS